MNSLGYLDPLCGSASSLRFTISWASGHAGVPGHTCLKLNGLSLCEFPSFLARALVPFSQVRAQAVLGDGARYSQGQGRPKNTMDAIGKKTDQLVSVLLFHGDMPLQICCYYLDLEDGPRTSQKTGETVDTTRIPRLPWFIRVIPYASIAHK